MTWKVKSALARKKLRIEDISELLGYSKSCISQVLSGQHKGYTIRPKIAALLGVSEKFLAREIDQAKPVNKSTVARKRAA